MKWTEIIKHGLQLYPYVIIFQIVTDDGEKKYYIDYWEYRFTRYCNNGTEQVSLDRAREMYKDKLNLGGTKYEGELTNI